VAGKLFIRRRDGRIEVRLNEQGRAIVKDVFTQVLAAERTNDHEWHASLVSPISPSDDHDNPMSILQRQSETSTNAELALASVSDDFINDAEAWAWLTSLQVALRSVVVSKGILSDEALTSAPSQLKEYVAILQQFLFALAEVL